MSLYKTNVLLGAALSALYTGAAAAMPQSYSLQMAPKAPSEVHDICSRLHNSASMARSRFLSLSEDASANELLTAYDELYGALFHLNASELGILKNAHPDPEIRNAAEECQARGKKLSSEVTLSTEIYARLLRLQGEDMSPEHRYSVDRQLKRFRAEGVNKDEKTRAQVAALQQKITALSQEFQRNLAEDQSTVAMSASALGDLPRDTLQHTVAKADGSIEIPVNIANVQAVLQFSGDEALRERMQTAWLRRGFPRNEPILEELLTRRSELAKLLGYKTYAEYDLSDKMAGTPENVLKFLEELEKEVRDPAAAEVRLLQDALKNGKTGTGKLAAWNTARAVSLVRQQRYSADPASVRSFLDYGRVKNGIFELAHDLFGVEVRPWNTAVWHSDVEAYEISEGGKVIGRFFLDAHPRPGKFPLAAVFPSRIGVRDQSLAVAALVANFPKEKLTHPQLVNFLHEFGHLLHWTFAGEQKLALQNFNESEKDSREMPSQLFEEWAWDYETLRRFARNDAGETIPPDVVAKLNASRRFGEAVETARQIGLAHIDLDYHQKEPIAGGTRESYHQIYHAHAFDQLPAESHPQTSFFHLLGYGAHYYTYQWSEALAADLLSRFRREGLRNPATADSFRKEVLAPGGSNSMNVLVENFLGRPWSLDAYKSELAGSDGQPAPGRPLQPR